MLRLGRGSLPPPAASAGPSRVRCNVSVNVLDAPAWTSPRVAAASAAPCASAQPAQLTGPSKPHEGRITPAKLARLSALLRLPITCVEHMLQLSPAAVQGMPPEVVAQRLRDVCTGLGLRPRQAVFMASKQPGYMLLTPIDQMQAKVEELAGALGVPPEAVLRAALTVPSILARSTELVQRRVAAYRGMLRCSSLEVLHIMARGPEYLSDTPKSVQARLNALGCVLRRPRCTVAAMLQARPDLAFMSSKVMNTKVNGLMCILNKAKRHVVALIVKTPALLRCSLDQVRAVYHALQAALNKREGFAYAMACHAPQVLLLTPRSLHQRCVALRRCLTASGAWQQQFAQLKPPAVARLLLNRRSCLSAMVFLTEQGRAGGVALEELVALEGTRRAEAPGMLLSPAQGRAEFVAWLEQRRVLVAARQRQRSAAAPAAGPAAAAPPRRSASGQQGQQQGLEAQRSGRQASALPALATAAVGLAAASAVPAGAGVSSSSSSSWPAPVHRASAELLLPQPQHALQQQQAQPPLQAVSPGSSSSGKEETLEAGCPGGSEDCSSQAALRSQPGASSSGASTPPAGAARVPLVSWHRARQLHARNVLRERAAAMAGRAAPGRPDRGGTDGSPAAGVPDGALPPAQQVGAGRRAGRTQLGYAAPVGTRRRRALDHTLGGAGAAAALQPSEEGVRPLPADVLAAGAARSSPGAGVEEQGPWDAGRAHVTAGGSEPHPAHHLALPLLHHPLHGLHDALGGGNGSSGSSNGHSNGHSNGGAASHSGPGSVQLQLQGHANGTPAAHALPVHVNGVSVNGAPVAASAAAGKGHELAHGSLSKHVHPSLWSPAAADCSSSADTGDLAGSGQGAQGCEDGLLVVMGGGGVHDYTGVGRGRRKAARAGQDVDGAGGTGTAQRDGVLEPAVGVGMPR